MGARPQIRLRWAGQAAVGAVVQPPSGLANGGWAARQVPPAPYMNAWMNVAGGWVDYLLAAPVTSWTRRVWGCASFDAVTDLFVAADTVSEDSAATWYRYVVAGVSLGSPAVRVSKRGLDWVDRSTLLSASGVVGAIAGVAFGNGQWWMWGAAGGVGWLVTTPADDGTYSAIRNAVNWTALGFPATTGIRGFAYDSAAYSAGGRLVALQDYGGAGPSAFYSVTNGVAWVAATFDATWNALTPSGRDVIWTGAAFVAAGWGARLVLARAVSPSDVWATAFQDGAAINAAWRLATDGAGTVVCWPFGYNGNAPVYASTDHGATWSMIALPGAMTLVRGLRFQDGQWVAAQGVAPYLWVSNDLVHWTPLRAPIGEEVTDPTLRALTYAEGAWLAVGNGYCYATTRAVDPAPGAFLPNNALAELTDAASLRGVPLDPAAATPGNGTTLVYSTATGRWMPSTVIPPDSAWSAAIDGAGTTAVEVAGVVTLTVALGVTVPTQGPSAAVRVIDGERWEWRARLTLTGADTNTRLALESVADSGYELTCALKADGSLNVYSNLSGADLATTIAGAVPLGGTGWLRLRFVHGVLVAYYGTGVGAAPPTTWTRLGPLATAPADTAPAYQGFRVRLYQGVGAAGTVTAVVDHLSITTPAP